MKTTWDYTNLAKSYNERADYSIELIESIYKVSGLNTKSLMCDIGAGVGHLTKLFSKKVKKIFAVEPNDEMRKFGELNLNKNSNITWVEAVAENTQLNDNYFDIVTFGSSFNVCDRNKALLEVDRILKSKGWFCCLWNHRDLNDEIQIKIEKIIKSNINNYSYGARREDQSKILEKSNFFNQILKLESKTYHSLPLNKFIEAWKSHATLERQAEGNFNKIVEQIQTALLKLSKKDIVVPYNTVAWLAQKK